MNGSKIAKDNYRDVLMCLGVDVFGVDDAVLTGLGFLLALRWC